MGSVTVKNKFSQCQATPNPGPEFAFPGASACIWTIHICEGNSFEKGRFSKYVIHSIVAGDDVEVSVGDGGEDFEFPGCPATGSFEVGKNVAQENLFNFDEFCRIVICRNSARESPVPAMPSVPIDRRRLWSKPLTVII
jgi:hypothetical protein